MATLARVKTSSTEQPNTPPRSHALSLDVDVPKPFPTRAEREQAELLEGLALEDLDLDNTSQPVPGPSTSSGRILDVNASEVSTLRIFCK